MEREIKFRAWDKEDQRMIVDKQDFIPLKVCSIGVFRLSPAFVDDLYSLMPLERFEIMQSTGLKDKKGVEMYHKDILKLDDIDDPVVINWSSKSASFCLNKEDWMFSHFFNEACTPDQCEVIGNIYTNPELIK